MLGDLWFELLSASCGVAVIPRPANAEVITPPDLWASIDAQGDQDGAETGETRGREGSEKAVGGLGARVHPGVLTDNLLLPGVIGIPSIASEGEEANLTRKVRVAAQIHAEEVESEARRRSKTSHADLSGVAGESII